MTFFVTSIWLVTRLFDSLNSDQDSLHRFFCSLLFSVFTILDCLLILFWWSSKTRRHPANAPGKVNFANFGNFTNFVNLIKFKSAGKPMKYGTLSTSPS